METIVGIISGILTSAAMLPQFFKLLNKKDAKNISLLMLFILIIGVCGWIYYGLLKKDIVIILTNVFSALLNIATFVLALKYKK